MGNNLKLEIYRITLIDRNGSRKDTKKFSEFYSKLSTDSSESYQKFIGEFKDYFNGTFIPNRNNTKGISTNENNNYRLNFEKNIINGEIFGGNIGNEEVIYKTNNSTEALRVLNINEIASLPFFIKLHTPAEHCTGFLFIQNYTNYTISDLIKEHLNKFFEIHGFRIIINSFIPNAIKETYRNKSSVYKVNLVKKKLDRSKRSLINPVFSEFENLKVTISISGFSEDSNSFFQKFKFNKDENLIGTDLSGFDILEEDDYEVKAYFKDEEGHKANIGLKSSIDISPTIFLPENVKIENKNTYDFDKIIKFTDSVLQDCIKEDNLDA